MPKEGVEIVNFTLTQIHSYTTGQMSEGSTPILDPSEKEFQSLIKLLSGESGLDELIKDTPTQSSFRYRRYSEVSEFLRGLTLNFPEITSLHRYSSLMHLTDIWHVGFSVYKLIMRDLKHRSSLESFYLHVCLSLREHLLNWTKAWVSLSDLCRHAWTESCVFLWP